MSLILDPKQPFALYRLPNQQQASCVSGPYIDELEISQITDKQLFTAIHFKQNSNKDWAFQIDEANTLTISDIRLAVWETEPDLSEGPFAETNTTKTQYLEQVRALQHDITQGRISKGVLSRPMPVEADTSLCFQWFADLAERYPTVMVCLMHFPGRGTWLTATPEVLATVEGRQLTTMSLAGTQADEGLPLDEVQWGAKELEEQRIVTDYISKVLKPYSSQLQVDGPTTISTGKVLHLRTMFKAQLKDTSQLPELLAKLHPTPAVSGFPKQEAMQVISEIEKYDRALYTGYFGLLGQDDITSRYAGITQLFVNLRCMQLFRRGVVLYLGGGITADSDPEAEWHETELKAQTLLSVMQ